MAVYTALSKSEIADLVEDYGLVKVTALSALAEESRARGVDMGTLAIAWVLRHPLMTAAIIGPRSPAHLGSALAALDVTVSADDAARLGARFSAAGAAHGY